jgi:hypothetical protein
LIKIDFLLEEIASAELDIRIVKANFDRAYIGSILKENPSEIINTARIWPLIRSRRVKSIEAK